ncbi:jg20429 [Pararge aegeria aegeria]|uniref:Jg20429 protein n=1 Tax=Pararge aegeria aegeria TaxID=348720 RepID=A0A8S4RXK2_9NEOP|nr:jg20429 [Pararge aegeria aegeria]
MFCPHKNSYLQLVCAVNPRVINKAVDRAMEKKHFDPRTEAPAAQRLESMQPSLYAPHVDITRARLGFGRVGLRLINRDLHSPDHLVQLQALHSIWDQVQISENAMFLINLHVGYRLIDLMLERDAVVREKVCLILTILASYYQGRKQIMSRIKIVENLMWLVLRDRREIRYAAAYTLRTLSSDRCSVETLLTCENIIENLLKMVKNDYTGIVLLHLKTLENLTEWNPEGPLKANAFQIMLQLFSNQDPRIVCGAMDCMTQLCKHPIGKQLADIYDLTFVLRPFIMSQSIEIRISAVGLMEYTTLTTRSKWRAKECCEELTKRLVSLCCGTNKPPLQLRSMQVLINLCDCPDIRHHMKRHWERKVKALKIRNHEEWDGTTETTSYGLETGHNYRTMCIEGVETIKNDYGDNAEVINVHSYLRRMHEVKARLFYAINWKSFKD